MNITDQDYENPWLDKNGQKFSLSDDQLEKLVGFVYIIEGLSGITKGKKYIGQKLFWSRKKLIKVNPKTKVKKKVSVRCESDWKKYYGSSPDLQSDIEKYGKQNFSRKIIHLCNGKGDMNYLEMREQIISNSLLREDYYNSFIGGKIHRKHLSKDIL